MPKLNKFWPNLLKNKRKSFKMRLTKLKKKENNILKNSLFLKLNSEQKDLLFLTFWNKRDNLSQTNLRKPDKSWKTNINNISITLKRKEKNSLKSMVSHWKNSMKLFHWTRENLKEKMKTLLTNILNICKSQMPLKRQELEELLLKLPLLKKLLQLKELQEQRELLPRKQLLRRPQLERQQLKKPQLKRLPLKKHDDFILPLIDSSINNHFL